MRKRPVRREIVFTRLSKEELAEFRRDRGALGLGSDSETGRVAFAALHAIVRAQQGVGALALLGLMEVRDREARRVLERAVDPELADAEAEGPRPPVPP